MNKIRDYLKKNGPSKTSEVAQYMGLSPARTRAIISHMEDVKPLGNTTNRTYQLKNNK